MFVFSIHIGLFCKYIILKKEEYFQIKTVIIGQLRKNRKKAVAEH